MSPAGAAAHGTGPGGLPAPRGGLGPRRRGLGLLLAVLSLPTLTAVLVLLRGQLALGSVLLLYLVVVVGVSVVGGIVPGAAAALASFLLANYFLTPPYQTLVVEERDSVIALVVFLVVAVTVSALVDVAARLQAAASRSEAEALLLGRVAAAPLATRTPEDVLGEVATAFGLTSVTLVDERTGQELARVGAADAEPVTVRVPAGGGRLLLGQGRALFAEDRRLLGDLAHAASRAADARALADEAHRATELAEVDRLRSALLAALGHDLRTPLTSIGTAVGTLRQPDLHLGAAEQAQLLGTIEQSTHRLSRLVTDLLDLSRLQAGALRTELVPLPVDEVVARSLLDGHLSDVHNTLSDDLPLVLADATLLERVVSNLADNALRYAPPGAPVEIRATSTPTEVEVAVIDHGPGVAESDWPRMFVPFQRLDDGRTGTGVGLGLAIARGLSEAMGATLRPARTPGGGLTMTLTLPRAAPTRATPVP